MKAAWYESQGAARDVLVVGEMLDPSPEPGEVRIRLIASGINPGDLKKREDAFRVGMSYPRVIPHSDGAGIIDQVGEGVETARVGQRVWCFGAQSYRPFGTAAQYTVVPTRLAVPLPEAVTLEAGACLGIPGVTAHRAVHVGGPMAGRNVLVQGGGGAVGLFAIGFSRQAGAQVLATVRSPIDEQAARNAGAHHVVRTDRRLQAEVLTELSTLAPSGVQHIVEVAFDVNVDVDTHLLAQGGTIAAYSTQDAKPTIPFWELLFKNARLFLLGSDDFPLEDKLMAAAATNQLLIDGWKGLRIDKTFSLTTSPALMNMQPQVLQDASCLRYSQLVP